MASTDDKGAPLSDASESDINRLVDDVLRSGKHLTLPDKADLTPRPERYHARAIAQTMHQLALQISQGGADPGASDDLDEWWFEVNGKRIGPISLRKIRFLWEDGELTPDSLCWHEGFPKWVSLFKVSELAEALTPSLHVNVDAAVKAFQRQSSGEWASPAASAMEAANRRRLEESQKRDPLPLSTPISLADERAATYTALRTLPAKDDEVDDDDDDERPRAKGAFGYALAGGLVAGLIAAGAIVGTRVLLPPQMVQPIVINLGPGAVPAVPAAAPVAEAPKPALPTPPPAPANVPVPGPVAAAPKPAPPPAAPAAPAAPAPEKEKKPATVEEAFAKAFAEAPPDELTTAEVLEVVRSHKAQVDACVDQQKAATPESSGKLVMRWSVDPDGHVSDVTSPPGEMAKSPLSECLAKEIAAWTFPKHAMQHPPVEVPFKF